jgi:hypothetical protein
MTRAPRFSGPGSPDNLTAEDLQAEMQKPESDRSEAAKYLTDTLRSQWDRFKDLIQYRNGVVSLNDGKKNRLSRSQRRNANLVERRRGLSTWREAARSCRRFAATP